MNYQVILIVIVSILALGSIAVLYSILMYQGGKVKRNDDLLLSTKNVLEQVKILYDKKEYALVELLASKYLDRVPTHQEVRRYLAKAYYRDKKYNNSIKHCNIILNFEPYDIDIRKLLGDCYIKKESPGKALREYEIVVEHRDDDKQVVKTLAELYRETEQIYSSITAYNALVELLTEKSEIAAVQSILAELNEEISDYAAAHEAYKARLEIYPDDVATNQKLVVLYIKLENPQKAIETLTYMLTIVTEPRMQLWTYETLIDLYVEAGDYEKALEYSNGLLEVQGADRFKVKNNIAKFNIKLNNYETGLSILEELAALTQYGFDVTIELADGYVQCKMYQEALDKYLTLLDKSTQKEAKILRPLICDLYVLWATDLSEEGNLETSYEYLEKAKEYNVVNPEIYYRLALNKMAQKDNSGAVEQLLLAVEYDKNNENKVRYYLTLSEAHHNLGNFFEEKKALTDLLKIDPKNSIGLLRSGIMYAAQHDIKNAEDHFNKALESDPDLLEAKFNLALLYENNSKERAKDLYMEILRQDPNYEPARKALSEILDND